MSQRYRVSITSFVFDSGAEYSALLHNLAGASDDLELAFRLAYHTCKASKDFETNDGETLQYVKILEGDTLVAMAKYMFRGEGPDTHYYLEWLQAPDAVEVKEAEDKIEQYQTRPGWPYATDFTVEADTNRIRLLKDFLESKKLGPQQHLLKLIFRAEKFMGFPSTKVKRLEDDLGL